ncbi:MAG: SHOCT domain-containing protein [Desulfobacterales bacterium]
MISAVTCMRKKIGRMNRYSLGTTIFLLAVLAAVMTFQPGTAASAEPKPLIVQVLFVQNAEAVVFGKGTLTLKGVSPMTVFFSDRPVRIAGHFNTKDEFVPLWDEGKDSFLKDPPNATVSMYEKGREQLTDVVVKLSRPRLAGKDLTYDITVIEGKVPQKGGPCSVFIDIIGLPFTPLSFAGVARRTAYRTVMWDTAATSAAATAAMATYPTNVTVNETVSPPPTPAVTNTQAEAVARLKELKSLQQQGLITEAQYQAESQKLLNQMVE